MTITRIDALVDAIARMNCYHSPLSEAYFIRNPGMLKAFSPKHVKNEAGYRVFNSFSSGYDNLRIDVLIKCSGKSRSKLTPDDTLVNLMECYGYPKLSATYVKKFLRHALRDQNIMETQKLSWFLEDQPASEHLQQEGE